MKYILILLTLFFVLPAKLPAQKNNTLFIQNIINKHANILLKNKEIGSVSIGIYKDGETTLMHFGELEKGKGNVPTNETMYEIASVTKTMTGFLIAKAEQEGKINLDDDLRKYLKEEYSNLAFNGKPITIKHLITHTSGLPAFLPLEMNTVFQNFNADVPYKFNEIEQKYDRKIFFEDLHKVMLINEPGNAYQYSNVGAELVGYILETVYEKRMDELLKTHLFKELDMSNSGITLNESQKQQLALGYWMDNITTSPSQLNKLWSSASGVKSTLPDLINYLKFQLDSNNPIVSKTHQVLYEEGKTLKLGYFWRIWTDKHGTSYNHHGGTTGTQNWMYIYPKYNLGIIIITNHSGPKTPNKLSETVQSIIKDIIKQ